MKALDRYRKTPEFTVFHSGVPAVYRDVADAAIAELEAELTELTEAARKRHNDWVACQAELAALRESSLKWGKLMNEQRDELTALKANHCRDCCCAQAWQALGVSEYDGKSIPEHITELREELAALKAINSSMADDVCSMTGVYDELAALKRRRCDECSGWHNYEAYLGQGHCRPTDCDA